MGAKFPEAKQSKQEIRNFLTVKDAEKIIHTFVDSGLDYRYTVLSGRPKSSPNSKCCCTLTDWN